MRRLPLGWMATAMMLLASGCALFGGGREPEASAEWGAALFHDRDFGSPHQTGVPYALAVAAIERYPEQLGGSTRGFCDTFGITPHPDHPDSLPIGFALHRDGITGLDFAMTNCSLCHSGEIGGQIVPGLGSRDLRLNTLNRAIIDVVSRDDFNAKTMLPLARDAAKRRHSPWSWRGSWATRMAIGKLKQRARTGMGNAFGGMKDVDAGPGRNSAIEFAKAASKAPIGPPYSFAKYPAVWVYRKRATFGFDGSIVGDRVMALSAIEFNKLMPGKTIVKQRSMWQSVYDYMAALQPPRYPGEVDSALAETGHVVFLARCAKCHGTYAQGGDAEAYKESVVPLSVVGTDPDRLHSVSPELVAVRRKGPLSKYVWIEPQQGYVAPPLDGIWCRGPYLHNGSVPTLVDLLGSPEERPATFYVGSGTDYDLQRLGIACEDEPGTNGRRAGRRASPKQSLFDTSQPGNGNGGHAFSADLLADERRALLEYLKRL